MKLHTKLSENEVRYLLLNAQLKGRIARDIYFTVLSPAGSRSHERAFEVQLGTEDKNSLPPGTKDQYGKKMSVRRHKNSGDSGASSIYAATWHEWKWFIHEVFRADPSAVFGGYSRGEFS